jgi:acyl carrier protein
MEQLVENLKVQIIQALKLEDVKPEDINENEPLFGEGLGLDSIDALELIVLMEKEYGIRVENANAAKSVFTSVKTMADYIAQNKK